MQARNDPAGGRFTVRGRLAGADVAVTWDHARLSGSDAAVDAIASRLRRHDAVRLSPQSSEHPARLDDPTAVLAAAQEALDEIVSVDGDYPLPEADSSAS